MDVVTSAELVSGMQRAQDTLFVVQIIELMGSKAKKPMTLEIGCKGAVDMSRTWSVSGQSRRDNARQSVLRELNKENIVDVKWMPTDENSSDLFTKNLSGPKFEQHAAAHCLIAELMSTGKKSEADD